MATNEVGVLMPASDAIEVFCSYSHKDDALREELDTHLSILQANGIINSWHDHAIPPGKEWAAQIDEHLNSAQIILLLISPDFLASKYCREVEVRRALERHRAGEATVISIMLRDVDLHASPLGHLQVLPKDAKPIVNWPNRDQAFKDVTVGIRKVVQSLRKPNPVTPPIPRPSPKPNHDQQAGYDLVWLKRYAPVMVVVVLMALIGAGYFAISSRNLKRIQAKDWKKVRYDDPDFSNCRNWAPCEARRDYAHALTAVEWHNVPYNSSFLADCMELPGCIAARAQADKLQAVMNWSALSSSDRVLLQQCMSYPACLQAQAQSQAQSHPPPPQPRVTAKARTTRSADTSKPGTETAAPLPPTRRFDEPQQ